MTARQRGRVFSDRVTILEPTETKAFYRLTFLDSDGRRRERTGGTSPATALARAATLDRELDAADPASHPTTLGALVSEYLATPRRRRRDKQGYPTGKDWSESHYAQVKRDLRRAVAGMEDLPAAQLDLDAVDRMRTACGSDPMVRQMTTCVRTFLRWAHEQGALTDAQAALLPSTHARPARPRFLQAQPRPARVRSTRMQGQSEDFVNEEDCPTPQEVLALARALEARIVAGELAVHLAAGGGLRIGEQFQLTADDVREPGDSRRLDVEVRAQWATNPTRRAAPKTGKRRTVPISPITRWGYPLQAELRARVSEARAEQASGRNPDALLFPAPHGGMWWSSSLSGVIIEAQRAAGWTYIVVHETRTMRNGRTAMVDVTQMNRTWHSLRHRFARDMIDGFRMGEGPLMAIGGWESIQVVQARYYRTGAEHVAMAAQLLGAGVGAANDVPVPDDLPLLPHRAGPARLHPAPSGRVTRASRAANRPRRA